MDQTDGDDALFRSEAKAWIRDNFPPALAGRAITPFHKNTDPDDREYLTWQARMAERGWGAPTWPRAYGGADLSEAQAKIVASELASAGAFNPIGGMGMTMLGPTLLKYGTEEQKRRHLPPIARGEIRWCQGFSEPGAGSDLASLRTRAEDRGDHWLVNGQKIWTSGANLSDWCFCLVRTDTSHKQKGITFVLIDMRTPGVEARPIRLINGVSHFCELFLTDVKVPKDAALGAVNDGWSVANFLLRSERSGLSASRGIEQNDLVQLAKERVGADAGGRIADPDVRSTVVRQLIRNKAYQMLLRRIDAEEKQGGSSVPVSVLKNLGASIAQARLELAADLIGADALALDGENEEPLTAEGLIANNWLYSRCYSIYGGSQEVQNNITARRILDLPVAKASGG